MAERQVDDPWSDLYVGRARSAATGILRGITLASGLVACAGPGPEAPAPGAPLERAARSALEETRLREPVRIDFEWRLNESGTRLGGRGVARMEPPYRARLDLFTENGETAARAVLMDGDLRLPAGVDRRLIPPAPLLWTSLGVFRPGDQAELVGGERRNAEEVRLEYDLPGDGGLGYELREETVRTAELLRDGHVVERVVLDWSGRRRFPNEAIYRDLTAFRELTVTLLESMERVEPYPTEIWHPDG